MKLPHIFMVHSIQLLLGLAIVMTFIPWRESSRTMAIFITAAGEAGLITIVTLQVFSELAPLDLDPLSDIVLILSDIVFGSTYLVVILACVDPPYNLNQAQRWRVNSRYMKEVIKKWG